MQTHAELQDDWKTYASLTVAQGQIRVRVVVKKNIRAMVQWTKDQIRTGKDPSATPFTLANVSVGDLLEKEKSHENWVKRAKEKSDAAMPKDFKEL